MWGPAEPGRTAQPSAQPSAAGAWRQGPCCVDTLAMGNATYQSGPLGPALVAMIPSMTQLLGDPQIGILQSGCNAPRMLLVSCNQCCISCGQLGAWRFRGGAVKCQVPPRFLEKACGDSQVNVKEATLPPSLPSRASDKSPASITGWWYTALED